MVLDDGVLDSTPDLLSLALGLLWCEGEGCDGLSGRGGSGDVGGPHFEKMWRYGFEGVGMWK